MLTPEQLERLPIEARQLWQDVEDSILQDMARRIKKMGEVSYTTQYQAEKLKQMRLFRRGIVKRLAEMTRLNEAEIYRLFQEAGTMTLLTDDEIHRAAGREPPPFNDSPQLVNLLNAGAEQTANEFLNITRTTADTATKQFERMLDRAWLQVSSGAFDYSTAYRHAVRELAKRGIEAIACPSGHVDTIEVAFRRALLTGVNQSAAQLQIARADQMGCEFVETTAHPGARPEHARWQGGVFHRGGAKDGYPDFETSTGYGTGAGLCGWNCRHNFYPFYPDISKPNYSARKLKQMERPEFEWDGEKLTRYEMSQVQRSAERKVRKLKRLYAMEKDRVTAMRLLEARQKLAEIESITGKPSGYDRTYQHKFGRSEAARASWALRK